MMPALSDLSFTLDGCLSLLVGFYFIGAIWFVCGTRRKNSISDRMPMVSVVVAARNEAIFIEGCLRALGQQDYPSDKYEVIVVDDGSTDGTDRLAIDSQDGPTAMRLLRTGGGGSKKAALSLGISAAKGEIILSTDADCLVAAGWIRGMVAHFSEGVGFVIGYSQIGSEGQIGNWRQGYEAADFANLMNCICGSAGWGHPMAASGQNLGFLRRIFDEVGGYEKVMHRASGDDVLLLQMVRNLHTWSIVFASDKNTFTRHPFAGSWSKLLAQRSRWASNAPVLSRLDPLFFLYMLNTYLMSCLVLVAPVLLAVGWMEIQWIIANLGLKFAAEWVAFCRGVALAGRRELYRYFPFWVLLQPLHVVIVGSMGVLGLFEWKGHNHRWGRKVQDGGQSVQ